MGEGQERPKAKILIVEDEGLIALDLKSRLRRMGYQVVDMAPSAKKAFSAIENKKPDLILMDIVLNGPMDGIEAAEIIRARWDLPVIFVTANADQERLDRVKPAHPFGFIIKPFTDHELRVTLDMAVHVSHVDAERRKAEAELRESEKRFRTLVEQAPEAIVVYDVETHLFVEANAKAERLFGCSRDVLLSSGPQRFYAPKQPDKRPLTQSIRENIDRTLAGEHPVFERAIRTLDGRDLMCEVRLTRLPSADKKLIRNSYIDITSRKLAEKELLTYRRHLEEMVDERTVELARVNQQLLTEIEERKKAEQNLKENVQKFKFFSYSVAHDLKSPAIAICGLTRRLLKKYSVLTEDQGKDYCRQIHKTAEHVASLVEQINIYISAKEAALTIEKIHFPEILQILNDEFSTQLSVRQIQWIEPKKKAVIRADRLSLLRIFRNLIDNALKYGGESLSRIRIGYEEKEGFHLFSVNDNGKGVPEKDSAYIFKMFKRPQSSNGIGGTGLGLAIVKEIAERHGGRVWVESKAGKGVTFYISLAKTL
jgi:PAS domain S-box-containing protein